MVKVLNTIHEDYHMHSMNYSDGMNSIDEIVQYAGKFGMKKIIITDHSQNYLEKNNIFPASPRTSLTRRENVHNDVEVSFGIEGDLLNEEGDICYNIKWSESDFLILSCHNGVYAWNLENITEAYINAIKKHHDKIKMLGHVCYKNTSKYLDIEKLVSVANEYKIPIELNAKYLMWGRTDKDKLDTMLNLVDQIYVNSDGHTLSDFKVRHKAFDYLREKGYLK